MLQWSKQLIIDFMPVMHAQLHYTIYYVLYHTFFRTIYVIHYAIHTANYADTNPPTWSRRVRGVGISDSHNSWSKKWSRAKLESRRDRSAEAEQEVKQSQSKRQSGANAKISPDALLKQLLKQEANRTRADPSLSRWWALGAHGTQACGIYNQTM